MTAGRAERAPASWLLYGASGFTGERIARRAVEEGLSPIVAGRSRDAVRRLGEALGVPWRVFDLSSARAVREGLSSVRLVLHCAGPFADTALPMAEAAIATGCHYLDIAGEIAVFEALRARSDAATAASVMLLPGVGFDVVPTDCVARELARRLPGATHLELAFLGADRAAAGSVKTALRQLPHGSVVREAGALRTIPHFSRSRTLEVGGMRRRVFSIPWGDVSTAHHSTGIPNITVYTAFPRAQALALRAALPFARVLARPRVMRAVERLVDRAVPGPSDAALAATRCWIWGEATDARGRSVSMLLRTPDTYTLTQATSLLCVRKVLDGGAVPGFQTPSTAFGPDLVMEVPGVERLEPRSRETSA